MVVAIAKSRKTNTNTKFRDISLIKVTFKYTLRTFHETFMYVE